jgi:hypothetical protein
VVAALAIGNIYSYIRILVNKKKAARRKNSGTVFWAAKLSMASAHEGAVDLSCGLEQFRAARGNRVVSYSFSVVICSWRGGFSG